MNYIWQIFCDERREQSSVLKSKDLANGLYKENTI